MTDDKVLRDYSQEVYGESCYQMSVQSLVDSHRLLRSHRIEFEGSIREARKEAYAKSFKFHTESFKGKDMIDIDELRQMTLDEIIERITNGN